MKKYSKMLMDSASKLDAITNSCGSITNLTRIIVSGRDAEATTLLLKKISDIINSKTYQIEIKKVAQLVNSNLLQFYGFLAQQEIYDETKSNNEVVNEKTLDELLKDLNRLVGLKNVKEKVYDLIAFQKVQKLREKMNLHSSKNTMHMAFTGNPGTGKTTVARIVGHIYKQLGLLSKGQFIEVSRTDLIAGYQGQTALKVKKVIEKAKGGVLFIDEAYSITENDRSDSYGRECLTELTKALEDYREDLVVIVAGYTEPMRKFFDSNPGLKSRFNTFIEFSDYTVDELEEILLSLCEKNDYCMEKKAMDAIHIFLENKHVQENKDFSNGRFMRNIYDDLIMNHARRVSCIPNPTKQDLAVLQYEDWKKVKITT